MSYEAKIICDSTASGTRLTTMEVTLPRIVLAEFNTHRMFSRNSASSRAIPVEKRIQAILDNPFVPEAFAANKAGMQAGASLNDDDGMAARFEWLMARDNAVESARALAAIGVHKQWANRLIEPFSWTTIVVTSTEWENFFNLRISALAQPEIRRAAELMKAAMDASTPKVLNVEDWHLPYIRNEDVTEVCTDDDFYECSVDRTLAKISAARCARVSYLTHDGVRDIRKDIELHDRLFESRHMSPFEHPALVTYHAPTFRWASNFRAPWLQYRKMIPNEDIAPKEMP